ncbi:hypothetical protein PNEG_01098 [Pneumocystis murina B123]|uniref:TATA-binding protein interacting (TIP20) domain-containing protein n=1 Tax=Pneumocystis murina (strain B123) TaxID=1069680 RepID=M7NQF5_PNEMU|nr:hypothetical protein PNEG_01098 [Pneumocystis murina B123]EMR10953.1 hypothetical protein PNEG_01098 [Pneumocystis murina B123]
MADKELKLLNKVEFHLGLANTDIELENTLKTYLCPTLLKLASPYESVRKKVLQICSHIRLRIKSNEDIKLPIDMLLEQFHSETVENFVKNFTLLFLEMAFFRSNEEKKKKMLSKLIPRLSTYFIEHKKKITYLIFHILEIYGDPHKVKICEFEDDQFLKSVFDAFSEDFAFLANVFKDLSLFSLSYFHSLSKKLSKEKIQELSSLNYLNNTNLSLDDANFSLQISILKKTCPGLSFNSFKFLTPKGLDTFNIDVLNRIKIGVIQFLSTSYFSLDQKFVTFIIFKFDADYNISSFAEACLKKLSIDLENEKIINRIYSLLIGNNNELETAKRNPVSAQIYIHLIYLLTKSYFAAKNVENMLKLLTYGLQNNVQKIVQATIAFVNWIARISPDDILKPIIQPILTLIINYIQNDEDKNEHLKEQLFTSFGLIARRETNYIDISVLKFLFDSLKRETKSVRFSIEQSLFLIMPCFQNIQEKFLEELNSLLFQIITSDHTDAHFSALRYCLAIFPFHESRARMLCLICLRENCIPKVKEEAKKGLNPYWFSVINQMKDIKQNPNTVFSENNYNFFSFPVFEDLIETLENQRLNGDGDNFFSHYFESLSPSIKNYMIKFIRQTLIMNLLQNDEHIQNFSPLNKTWEEQLDIAISDNEVFRTTYKKKIDIAWNNNTKFKKYLINYFQYVLKNFYETPLEFAYDVLELISLGPDDLTVMLTDKFDLFQTFLLFSNENLEYNIPHILGIVGSHFNISIEKITELLMFFTRSEISQTNRQFLSSHSSLLSLGYLLSRLKLRGRLTTVNIDLLYKCYSFIIEKVSSSNKLENISALVALGELCIFDTLSDFKSSNEEKFNFLIMTILDLYKKSKTDIKLREIITITLGKIATTMDPKQPEIDSILNCIFENYQTEYVYSYFIDGEALSCIAIGWKSKFLYKFVDMSISGIPETSRPEHMDFILKKILQEYIISSKPSLRKASIIWLLSLIRYCGESLSIQDNILIMQNAFILLLSDKDSFIQELASKGLKLLYEKCSEEVKSSLVHDLILCLTNKKKIKRTITSETELFDHEIHHENNTSISTYGDVCSLATELGNPELVYQFLNISLNSTIWQTRKGVAFSINEIISTNTKIDIIKNNPELFKKMISCLFLYKFHPISDVKKVMENVFSIFVNNSEKISEFNKDIMDRLLKGLGDQSWYIREASCNAIAHFLRTQTVENIEFYLEDIIIMSFRAVDDIKETVRLAASVLCRYITSFIIKNIDYRNNKKSNQSIILEKSIPILLKSVISDIQEVKGYALDTLIKICDTAKLSLKPFIPELIDNLLNFLTELEPQVMNYLELNTERFDITQEQLNDARVSLLRTSPILNAIESCIDQFDEEIARKTIPLLLNITQKAVGLPTKLACSKVIISIILRKNDCVSLYAKDVFRVFQECLFDRNHTVRISFSISLGYIARIALIEDLILLDSNLKKIYFEEKDEKKLITVASVYKHISIYANEKFVSLFYLFLPIVFLGKHDQFESVSFQFNEIWNENAGGSGFIALYLNKILNFIFLGLENNHWRLKMISAIALIEVIKFSKMDEYLDKLIPILMDILEGKLWDGKEVVLDAFITLLLYNENYLLDKAYLIQKIFNILVRETKRNNINYQRHVLCNFNRYVERYLTPESFENIYSVIEKNISNDSEKKEIYENNEISMPMGLVLREHSLNIIASAFHPKSDRTYACYVELVRIWRENIRLTWNIQTVICKSIQKIFKKNFLNTFLFDQLKNGNTLLDNWNIIYYALGNKKYESVRNEAVKAAKIFIESLKDCNDFELKSRILKDFNEFKSTEKSSMIKAELNHICFSGY